MRHAAGDFNQRLDASQRFGKREDLGGLAEALSSLLASLDAERKHASAHAVAVLLSSDVVLGVRREAGVVDSDDMRRGKESIGDLGRVGGGLPGT